MRSTIAYIVCSTLLPAATTAQHQHAASPYADFVNREIKALSSEQMEDYLSARGMGLALAAELNAYPGPLHVLEHADMLGLDAAQRRAVTAVRDTMQQEALALGRTIVEREKTLDSLFRDESIDDTMLAVLTSEIGELQGRLRYVHLRAHLAVNALLSGEQVESYQRMRGYVR